MSHECVLVKKTMEDHLVHNKSCLTNQSDSISKICFRADKCADPDRGAIEDFSYPSVKAYVVTPHQNC